LTIGCAGHPITAASQPLRPGEGFVIADVNAGDRMRQRSAAHTTEPAPWLAYRDEGVFGFAAFDVNPVEPGGTTSIEVTYYATEADSTNYRPKRQFVLRKPAGAPGLADASDAGLLLQRECQ
jgi:hypothetical protein